ncbi:MAG TPA: 4-alpha-glucanotransferase, partial [Flavisolibacter sp.]|nr:4-alpha-glucanotransferase [Flavisolibacter sp.]
MRIDFYLRFHTKYGQSLAISGNLSCLGNNNLNKALPLKFLSDEFWHTYIEVEPDETDIINYKYIFNDEKGEKKKEGEKDRVIEIKNPVKDVIVIDTWNDESYYENAFYTAPFTEVYFRENKKTKHKKPDSFTHIFKVKSPLLESNESLCIIGSDEQMNNWSIENPPLLSKKGQWWIIMLNLEKSVFPVSYKYAVYNHKKEEYVRYEDGDNRVIHNNKCENKYSIIHDGFARLPNSTWKSAGVAIPVFSLRTNNGFGVGEFADIRLLVDWAVETGLKLIQILPVNDTSATFTWKDSYPYAAISAFALHPLYINLNKVAGKKQSSIIKPLSKKQRQLNLLPKIDYEQVISFKINVLHELFDLENLAFLQDDAFKEFFEDNKVWLVPYAAFCYLRDRYHTSDYSKWKTFSNYNKEEIERLTSERSKQFRQIAFHYFVQYHLHLQLKDAVDYAHKKGIALKGDIPIGIYRYGCDAWTAPELY